MLWATFLSPKLVYIFNHFYAVAPEATELGEIMQNKGHYAIQSHSMSPILVPIENSYTTSY